MGRQSTWPRGRPSRTYWPASAWAPSGWSSSATASLSRVGPDAIVGLSTHAPNELDDALDEPLVDYLSAGPVTQTPTKPGRPGTGLRYLTYVVERAKTPWFVTGGVTPESLPLMAAAGARRFVVVRYLTEAEDPTGAAKSLRAAIDKALKGVSR